MTAPGTHRAAAYVFLEAAPLLAPLTVRARAAALLHRLRQGTRRRSCRALRRLVHAARDVWG